MDVLNFIYLILGIATSLIAVITAIFGIVKLVNNYTQSKQRNKSELYIPNHIKQPKKPKIKVTTQVSY